MIARGVAWLALAASAASGVTLEGTLADTAGRPIERAFLALTDAGFAPKASTTTGNGGAFSVNEAAEGDLVIVQPPGQPAAEAYRAYAAAPRIYKINSIAAPLALQLPPVACLVLEAYDADGDLMRWEDFEARGRYAGMFMYATSLDRHAVEAAAWPIFGGRTGLPGGPREKGFPALCVAPATVVVPQLLFWETAGYGKLQLAMDNAGAGFTAPGAGEALVLQVNLELARTAVHELQENLARYAPKAAATVQDLQTRLAAAIAEGGAAGAKQADAILAEALRARDEFELAAARAAIPALRRGTIAVALPEDAKVEVMPRRLAFDFGVYGGSPYRHEAFAAARAIGCNQATVLLAWNFASNPKLNTGAIDRRFGISDMLDLGYDLKAHGVVWLQQYGILPERVYRLPKAELQEGALAQQRSLLEVFGEKIALWEAINEPAHANVARLTQDEMIALLASAAKNLNAADAPALLNSPHEFAFGSQYLVYGTDNRPLDGYPHTYGAFLDAAQSAGALEHIDAIGLQVYPGFHFNAMFQNLQGPAQTPAHLRDTLARYARYTGQVHITEFSLPSIYGQDWYAGYWRQPWDEATQADYLEHALTLAYALPACGAFTWWDITDEDPAVLGGGLVREDGTPKPAFLRLRDLLAQWSETAFLPPTPGAQRIDAFAGTYDIRITTLDGATHVETVQVSPGETTEVRL